MWNKYNKEEKLYSLAFAEKGRLCKMSQINQQAKKSSKIFMEPWEVL